MPCEPSTSELHRCQREVIRTRLRCGLAAPSRSACRALVPRGSVGGCGPRFAPMQSKCMGQAGAEMHGAGEPAYAQQQARNRAGEAQAPSRPTQQLADFQPGTTGPGSPVHGQAAAQAGGRRCPVEVLPAHQTPLTLMDPGRPAGSHSPALADWSSSRSAPASVAAPTPGAAVAGPDDDHIHPACARAAHRVRPSHRQTAAPAARTTVAASAERSASVLASIRTVRLVAQRQPTEPARCPARQQLTSQADQFGTIPIKTLAGQARASATRPQWPSMWKDGPFMEGGTQHARSNSRAKWGHSSCR